MRPARRMLFGALGWLASSVVAFSAHAVPLAGGELTVKRSAAAADCPDENALSSSTLALGKLPEQPPTTTLTADVELDRDDLGYVARIRTTGRKDGYREIRTEGDTCAPLAEATSVALAILFDLLPPEPTPTPPPIESLPPAAQTLPAQPAAAERPKPPPPREPTRNVWLASVSAEGGIAYGLLGSAVTAHVGGALHLPIAERVEVSGGGFWAPGRTVPFEPGSVFVSLAAGRAGAALSFVRSKNFELGGRAEVLVGAITGEGKDFDHPAGETEAWGALSLGASGRYGFDRRFGLRFALSAFIPFRSQDFSVTLGDEPPTNAFESAPVAAVLELGPEVVFF